MTSRYDRVQATAAALLAAAGAAAIAACVTTAPASAVEREPRPVGDAAVFAANVPMTGSPELRTGILPSGLRYYVQANRAPAGRAELWLAVNVGSAQEDDDQLGYAHFLEHMAFNGTRNFPRQALIDFIESTGMRFGADLNAYTSFDETVYQLTVPTDDPSYLERGLTVLEDWASGGITIDPDEVVAERGVVLGEWRMRELTDTASARIRSHVYDVLFGGTPYRDRFPIGTAESIETATAEPLERFYRDWYRPDLMAVIAVGDFDAAAMEAEIRRRFGAIPAATEPRERTAIDVDTEGPPVVDILRDKVRPRVDVYWPAEDPPTDARALVRHELVNELLLGHVQRQIQHIRKQENAPFVDAQLGNAQLTRPMRTVSASVVALPDSLENGLAALLTEVERVARGGVPEAVLDTRKAALLRRLEHEAASAAARPSRAHASSYAQHFLTGVGALLDAAERLALAREILPGITPEVLADAARFWRDEQGVKVQVSVPQLALGFEPPTEQSVLAVFDSIRRGPLSPDPGGESAVADAGQTADDNAGSSLLPNPPEAGRVVDERRHHAAGVVEWTLSNGARVFFKESLNDPDDLRIRAWSPGGRTAIPDSLYFTTGRMVAHVMNEAAGLGETDRDELIEGLQTTGVRRLHVEIGYVAETIDVAGSPGELEQLFETLHLQFTAPKLDSAELSGWANMARYTPRPPESQLYQLDQIFMRGLPRYVPVQTATAQLAKVEDMLAVHEDRFGNAADFTFFVVGAAPEDEVRELVERYVASLPAAGTRETPDVPERQPFKGTVRQRSRSNQFARSDVLYAFDGPLPATDAEYLKERERLNTLTLVLERRLRDRLREEIAGTYGVSVVGYTYNLIGEHFRVLLQFQSDPELMVEMVRAMLAILDDVRAEGATEQELERVGRILQRRIETNLQDNGYWLEQLELSNRLGLPIDRIVAPYGDEPLTAEDLKLAASTYLPEDASVQVIVEPTREVMSALKSEDDADEPPDQRAAPRDRSGPRSR